MSWSIMSSRRWHRHFVVSVLLRAMWSLQQIHIIYGKHNMRDSHTKQRAASSSSPGLTNRSWPAKALPLHQQQHHKTSTHPRVKLGAWLPCPNQRGLELSGHSSGRAFGLAGVLAGFRQRQMQCRPCLQHLVPQGTHQQPADCVLKKTQHQCQITDQSRAATLSGAVAHFVPAGRFSVCLKFYRAVRALRGTSSSSGRGT